MKLNKIIVAVLFVLALSALPINNAFAGKGTGAFITIAETDGVEENSHLFYFFDLRDRETFIQLTFTDFRNVGSSATAHIQIWDVGNNCNENNFFDSYTVNDTHVYNMRDIQTNDGSPSGVVLPDGAYGIVTAIVRIDNPTNGGEGQPIGNMRMIDNNGYEYRTNAQKIGQTFFDLESGIPGVFHSFNFNTNGGVDLSDIVGIPFTFLSGPGGFEITVSPVQDIFAPFDVDIYDLNEVPFSCRDVVFSCVDEDNPLLDELLQNSGVNVASFEYGINNAIPHSKGGELLCPGNTISDGIVTLIPEEINFNTCNDCAEPLWFFGFAGLNNGNGRGSLDSFWTFNYLAVLNDPG